MNDQPNFVGQLREQLTTASDAAEQRHRRRSRRARAVAGICATLLVAGLATQILGDDTTDLRTTDQDPAESSPTTTPRPEPDEPGTATTRPPLATVPALDVGDGEIQILPEGPWNDGQVVTVLAANTVNLDTYNAPLRLCARVDGGPETCDPTLLRRERASILPSGTQGVDIALPQRHFGPLGDRDCADETVVCRLLWATESGDRLASAPLDYVRPTEPSDVVLTARPSDEPGVMLVDVAGLDTSGSPAETLPAITLANIEAWVGDGGPDLADVTLSWVVQTQCSFGDGEPPIGSLGLAPIDGFWEPTSLRPGSTTSRWLAPNCTWLGEVGDVTDLSSDTPLRLEIDRHVFGFGGWTDCAAFSCWLELSLRWRGPLPGGGSTGDDIPVARTFLDVPDTWPDNRPSIEIVEPGPFAPGDTVTVEARNVPADERWAIAFCREHWIDCGFREATTDGDVSRIEYTVPSGCGLNRCYFAVDFRSEGLPPSAIEILPVLEPGAADQCPAQRSEQAIVYLFTEDPPTGCVVVGIDQGFVIWNKGADTVTLDWPDGPRVLRPDESSIASPAQLALEPGPNIINSTPYRTPIVWLVAPEDTPTGPFDDVVESTSTSGPYTALFEQGPADRAEVEAWVGARLVLADDVQQGSCTYLVALGDPYSPTFVFDAVSPGAPLISVVDRHSDAASTCRRS